MGELSFFSYGRREDFLPVDAKLDSVSFVCRNSVRCFGLFCFCELSELFPRLGQRFSDPSLDLEP